jgi:hypothetical protein
VVTIPVVRGTQGTTPALCPAGSFVYEFSNSKPGLQYLKIPARTRQNGAAPHTLFFMYDFYVDQSFVPFAVNYKMVYFHTNGYSGSWLMPMVSDGQSTPYSDGYQYGYHPGVYNTRMQGVRCGVSGVQCPNGSATYLDLPLRQFDIWAGPNVALGGSFPEPLVTSFPLVADRWIRVAVKLEVRTSNYELMSIWIGDENRPMTLMIDEMEYALSDGIRSVTARQEAIDGPDSVSSIDIDWASSGNKLYKPVGCTPVAYVRGVYEDSDPCIRTHYMRNLIIMKDPGDVKIADWLSRAVIR